MFFVAVFLCCTSTGRVGLWFCGIYVQEHPKAQPAVVLVLKRLRRQGPRLKVSSDRLGEAGNRTCDPWFTCLLTIFILKDLIDIELSFSHCSRYIKMRV